MEIATYIVSLQQVKIWPDRVREAKSHWGRFQRSNSTIMVGIEPSPWRRKKRGGIWRIGRRSYCIIGKAAVGNFIRRLPQKSFLFLFSGKTNFPSIQNPLSLSIYLLWGMIKKRQNQWRPILI